MTFKKLYLVCLLLCMAMPAMALETYFTEPGGSDNPVHVKTAPGDSVDVFVQDQTTPAVEYFLYQELNDVTIIVGGVSKSSTLTFSAGHGFTLGDFIHLEYFDLTYTIPARIYQAEVVGVAGDVISFDKFFGFDIVPGPAVISSKRVNTDMSVLGSYASPVQFKFCTFDGLDMDLTRTMVDMNLTSGPDDGLYGNLARLTNGVFFGFEGDALDYYLVAIKDNGEYRSTAFDVSTNQRSGGGGTHGLTVRKTFAGNDKYGVAVRLEAALNDCYVSYVRDDLTLISRHRVTVMGHIVQ